MANNFESNITEKLNRIILEKFEALRVLSKMVNTQLLSDQFDPSTGDTVFFKRPTDYRTSETPDGDLTSETASDIITGKAKGVVQNYITVFVDFKEVDQALKMDQLANTSGATDELMNKMANRIVIKLETNFAKFMMKNTALLAGVVGTSLTTWDEVAKIGALMESTGIPDKGSWLLSVNPFTQVGLASDQRSLGAGGLAGTFINEAQKMATITRNFAGMDVMTATTLATYTSDTPADRAGTLTSAPDATYTTAKDSMQQTFAVTAFDANLIVKAGETLRVVNVNRLNLSTRELMLDADGGVVPWSGTVVADVILGGSGEGNIVVSGPAIQETDGQYDTVDAAPLNGAVVTLDGAASAIQQPNLFWHKDAFAIGSVQLSKLFSTDTIGKTADGIEMRVSLGSNFTKNSQQIRFDILPAFSVLNPFFSGQGFGTP